MTKKDNGWRRTADEYLYENKLFGFFHSRFVSKVFNQELIYKQDYREVEIWIKKNFYPKKYVEKEIAKQRAKCIEKAKIEGAIKVLEELEKAIELSETKSDIEYFLEEKLKQLTK